jgi:hypothetical protein
MSTMTPARRRATRATTAEGDNRNCDDDEDVCASVTGNDTASYEAATRREAEAARRKAEAARGREAAAARQVGRCELRQQDGEDEVEAKSRGGVGGGATTGATRQPARKQEANGRGGVQEANGRGGISGQEAAERREDERRRRRRRNVRRRDNQPEAPAEPPPPPPPPSPPAGMTAPFARSLATAAAATSPSSSDSSASAKFARPPSSLSTPSHRRRHCPRWTRGVPFWRRRRPL